MSVTTENASGVDRWFSMSARGSNYSREIRGGVVTFFTMAYIVVLNPLIIGTAKDMNGNYVGGGTDVVKAITMVAAATALVAGLLSIIMGIVGRFPVALAAGGLELVVGIEFVSKRLEHRSTSDEVADLHI